MLFKSVSRFIVLLLLLTTSGVTAANAAMDKQNPIEFSVWLQGVMTESRSRGVSEETLQRTLGSVSRVTRVIELDRRQPEFTLTFWKYINGSINDRRIKRGQSLLIKHKELLAKVSRKYGVQPRFLVSFWGLESNFGDYNGVFSAVGSLVTLAYDPRRSKFFREQLLALLTLIDEGNFPADIKSSWAGAMGNHQFIPTTYRDFAVDFDGDGKKDLWNSLPDIFASAANYLSKSGWNKTKTWGREVSLPKNLDLELTGLKTTKSLAQWQQLGVRRYDGRNLPRVDITASLILPAGINGPAFLVYTNFKTTLKWNRSIFYATAIGHLADRYAGGGKFLTPQPAKEIALARLDIVEIQRRLTGLGFDTQGVDGRAGPNTREAIKGFQKSVHLPADGFASMGLLERLRGL